MGDKLRRLPGEDKIFSSLLVPASDRVRCRCPIEHAVQLDGRKLAGVVLKLVLERQALGIERPAPRSVMPARRADQNPRHGVVIVSRYSIHQESKKRADELFRSDGKSHMRPANVRQPTIEPGRWSIPPA